MLKIQRLALLSLFVISVNSVYASNEMIKEFDQNQYSPIKYGLKDLIFEARVEGLEESLKLRFALDKLNDPHFIVYWATPGRIDIEVMGLPPGFETLKQELKKIIIERLEYIVPQDLSGRLRGYSFEESKSTKGTVQLKGKDETHSKPISQIHLSFDSDARLRSMKTFSPSGSQTAKFKVDVKAWSHSKRVVESVVLEAITGIQKNTVETTISYLVKDGFGLPKTIETITTVEAMTNKEGSNKETMKALLSFKDYKINSGEAQKYFMDKDGH